MPVGSGLNPQCCAILALSAVIAMERDGFAKTTRIGLGTEHHSAHCPATVAGRVRHVHTATPIPTDVRPNPYAPYNVHKPA